MGCCKGGMLLDAFEFARARFGEDSVDKVLASMKPADQEALRKNIMPISWVDFGALIRFLKAEDRLFGKGDLALLRENGLYYSEKSLKGLYKVILSFASPKMVAKSGAKIWQATYNAGQLSYLSEKEKEVTLELTGWPNMEAHHEIYQNGATEGAYSIAGAKNIQVVHPKCTARGDSTCVWVSTWE